MDGGVDEYGLYLSGIFMLKKSLFFYFSFMSKLMMFMFGVVFDGINWL